MSNVHLLIALCLIVFAVYKYMQTQRFLQGATFAQGHVIKVEKLEPLADIDNPEQYESYRYTVAFDTGNGQNIEFVSDQQDTEAVYKSGQAVQVAYQAASPQEAKLASFWKLSGPHIIAVGLAVVILVLGFFKQG